MMLINLLPHREAARKRRKEQFVMLAAGAASSWCDGRIPDQPLVSA
jgi:Tfp pilus assembly protein PilN